MSGAGWIAAWVVLGLWVAVQASGGVLLRVFLRRGGLDDEGVASSYPATLVANLALGTASVILWALFLLTGLRILAIATFAQLVLVVVIGTRLAIPWHQAQRDETPSPAGGGSAAFAYRRVPEATHGVLAWLTTILAGVVAFAL